MLKYLLLSMLLCVGGTIYADTPEPIYDSNIAVVPGQAVRITVQENCNVRIQFAEGLTLEVYDLVGKKQATYNIITPDETIALQLPHGYYLLKVGKHVRKIAL